MGVLVYLFPQFPGQLCLFFYYFGSITNLGGFMTTDVTFLGQQEQNEKIFPWQREASAPLVYLKAQGRKAVKVAAGEAQPAP